MGDWIQLTDADHGHQKYIVRKEAISGLTRRVQGYGRTEVYFDGVRLHVRETIEWIFHALRVQEVEGIEHNAEVAPPTSP